MRLQVELARQAAKAAHVEVIHAIQRYKRKHDEWIQQAEHMEAMDTLMLMGHAPTG